NMKEKVLVKNEASGIQPYGYKIVEKKRVIDEDEKEVVLLMIDLYKRYGSMATVAQELNKRGIPNRLRKGKRSIWRHQTVRQILRNPALCGTLVYDDEIIEDAFEGIISKEEFSKLSRQIERQNIIRLKSPTRGLFSGMLKCTHCKSILVKSEKRYRCNNCYESGNNFFAVSENGIEKGFIEYFKGMTIQPTESVAKKKTRSIESEIKRLEEKRKKFQQMYTDEFMTYAEFQESMKESNQAIAALQDELLTESEELSYEELKEYRWYIVENYELLTREEKIEFTNMFIKEISFKQIVTLYNKNGSPFRYKYIVDNVVFK